MTSLMAAALIAMTPSARPRHVEIDQDAAEDRQRGDRKRGARRTAPSPVTSDCRRQHGADRYPNTEAERERQHEAQCRPPGPRRVRLRCSAGAKNRTPARSGTSAGSVRPATASSSVRAATTGRRTGKLGRGQAEERWAEQDADDDFADRRRLADAQRHRASQPPGEHDDRQLQQREEQQQFGLVDARRSTSRQIIPPLIEMIWPVM